MLTHISVGKPNSGASVFIHSSGGVQGEVRAPRRLSANDLASIVISIKRCRNVLTQCYVVTRFDVLNDLGHESLIIGLKLQRIESLVIRRRVVCLRRAPGNDQATHLQYEKHPLHLSPPLPIQMPSKCLFLYEFQIFCPF